MMSLAAPSFILFFMKISPLASRVKEEEKASSGH